MPAKKGECDVKVGNIPIRWTGYKGSQFNCMLIGQWVASLPNGIYFSGTNGIIGTGLREDSTMDIGHDITPITIFSTAAEKEARKQEALARLIEYIKNNYQELYGR